MLICTTDTIYINVDTFHNLVVNIWFSCKVGVHMCMLWWKYVGIVYGDMSLGMWGCDANVHINTHFWFGMSLLQSHLDTDRCHWNMYHHFDKVDDRFALEKKNFKNSVLIIPYDIPSIVKIDKITNMIGKSFISWKWDIFFDDVCHSKSTNTTHGLINDHIQKDGLTNICKYPGNDLWHNIIWIKL